MSFKKYTTFEKTFSKGEIQSILRDYIERELSEQDYDFKNAKWIQDDFTYSFKDGSPSIEVVIILDDVKMR